MDFNPNMTPEEFEQYDEWCRQMLEAERLEVEKEYLQQCQEEDVADAEQERELREMEAWDHYIDIHEGGAPKFPR